jgi:hypothetical protein
MVDEEVADEVKLDVDEAELLEPDKVELKKAAMVDVATKEGVADEVKLDVAKLELLELKELELEKAEEVG